MKKITQLFTALVFLSLSIFIACGGGNDDPDPVDPRDAQGELLVGTYTESSVTVDGGTREEWDGFSLTVTYNIDTDVIGYMASGIPDTDGATDVWKSSGTATFDGTDDEPILASVTRDDGIGVSISNLSGTSLTLSFTVEEASGRTFDGNWVFSFTK